MIRAAPSRTRKSTGAMTQSVSQRRPGFRGGAAGAGSSATSVPTMASSVGGGVRRHQRGCQRGRRECQECRSAGYPEVTKRRERAPMADIIDLIYEDHDWFRRHFFYLDDATTQEELTAIWEPIALR